MISSHFLASIGRCVIMVSSVHGEYNSLQSTMVASIFSYSDIWNLKVQLGMASALETLCGQAFGAKQYHMLGIYLQRSWIVLTICAILLLPLFFFTTPILMALGQEENIAEVAGTISLMLIPVLFAFIVSFTCQMYLQAQSRNMIISYLAAFSFLLHLCLSWLFTVKLNFGLPGALGSTVLAYWIPNLGQLLFVTCGGCPQTWKGLSFAAFKDLGPVVKLSLSSGAMLWWGSCLIVFLHEFRL